MDKKSYKPRKPKVKEIDMTDEQLKEIGKVKIGDEIYDIDEDIGVPGVDTPMYYSTGGIVKTKKKKNKMKKPRGVGAALRGYGKACK
tara:strand:+ start:52 stop:312 length:261 start_codon:yes stop_codon:yes gene_type:complete